MPKIDHKRISTRNRISHESDPVRLKFEWSNIPFGKYQDITWPEVLLVDLCYFQKVTSSVELWGQAKRDVSIVVNRSKHILPSGTNPTKSDFAIFVDSNGAFEKFTVQKRIAEIKVEGNSRFIVRVPHLDMRFGLLAPKTLRNKAARRMAKCMKDAFSLDPSTRGGRLYIQRFFLEDEHFDLACSVDHAAG